MLPNTLFVHILYGISRWICVCVAGAIVALECFSYLSHIHRLCIWNTPGGRRRATGKSKQMRRRPLSFCPGWCTALRFLEISVFLHMGKQRRRPRDRYLLCLDVYVLWLDRKMLTILNANSVCFVSLGF